jgi:hypothetical protein
MINYVYITLMRHNNYTRGLSRFTIILAVTITLVACASPSTKPTLSDLKSRYWKGTYYLSVKESPTSIKCVVDEGYESPASVPVLYNGKDATQMFITEDDQAKIKKLRKHCFDGPLH